MEPCPHCGQSLDPQQFRYRGSWTENLSRTLFGFEWPSQRRGRQFTVRCPQCGKTYVSRTLRRFGFVTYDRYVTVVGVVCVSAVAIVLWVTR